MTFKRILANQAWMGNDIDSANTGDGKRIEHDSLAWPTSGKFSRGYNIRKLFKIQITKKTI